MSELLEIPVDAAESDPGTLRALDAIASEFPGPDQIVVVVRLSTGTTVRATLARRVDGENPDLLETIARILRTYRRPPDPST